MVSCDRVAVVGGSPVEISLCQVVTSATLVSFVAHMNRSSSSMESRRTEQTIEPYAQPSFGGDSTNVQRYSILSDDDDANNAKIESAATVLQTAARKSENHWWTQGWTGLAFINFVYMHPLLRIYVHGINSSTTQQILLHIVRFLATMMVTALFFHALHIRSRWKLGAFGSI